MIIPRDNQIKIINDIKKNNQEIFSRQLNNIKKLSTIYQLSDMSSETEYNITNGLAVKKNLLDGFCKTLIDSVKHPTTNEFR